MSYELRTFKNIAEHFNCPIHLGKLKDPRILPCEHTFCADCLNGCIKSIFGIRNDGMFECPVCRSKHHVPHSESNDWAIAFPVDAFCVIQLHTLSQYEKSAVCDKHIEKFKEYFCFHHREMICSDCVIEMHTKMPCSCGSLQDSIMEVRLQIKELIGKLRLQEERAQRIMDSKVASSHSDDLIRKISDVEKKLNKFHKTMKTKLKECKQKVVESTKISHSDRDHLGTIQSLITKTKSHVESILRPEKGKRTETVNEMFTVWTPLEQEIFNFDSALDEIETRPFCVNVKVDDEFLDFISYDKNPLTVTNDTRENLPPSPTKENAYEKVNRFLNEESDEVDPPSSPKYPSPLIVRKTLNVSSPVRNDTQKLYTDKRPVTLDSIPTPRQNHSRQQSPNRAAFLARKSHSSVLPKVEVGEVKTRATGKKLNNVDFSIQGITEESNFELPCGDIIIVNGHLITVTETAVQKFTLDYRYVESIGLKFPWRICAIRDTSNVAINHNTRFISIVGTYPNLEVMYRIETEKPYSQICHMRTQILEDRFGRVRYHEQLALTHTTDLRADCVDLLTVTYDKNPYSNFQSNQTTKLVPLKTKTLIGSDKHSVVRSPNALAATQDGKRLIIGAEAAVVCIKRTGDIIWTHPVVRFVASICCDKGLVFVCIENERKLMVMDEAGNTLYENMFPLSCNIVRPNRVSIEKSKMIVREFSERDWKSTVHVFSLMEM